MALCCPKSVRACAIRITRLNSTGVPLDPTAAESRILAAGFMELSLNPDYVSGESQVTRDQCGVVRMVDKDFDVLLGFSLKLRLCGVPEAVLEMMLGATGFMESGMALPDLKRFACREPLMVELWSKNVAAPYDAQTGTCDAWIHWVLPRTSLWKLEGDLQFTNGALDFTLGGYGTQNPGWYPSAPDPSKGFLAYEPASDPVLDRWPVGPGAVIPNPVMTLDEWTLDDMAAIRTSGPLGWKCVATLPGPLNDCGYVPSEVPPDPCVISYSMIGTESLTNPPWSIPPVWQD